MAEHDVTISVDFEGEPDSNEDNVTPLPVLSISEREFRLIGNCIMYASSDPAGLPGHNLMLLVAKLAEHVDDLGGYDYTPDNRTAPYADFLGGYKT